MNSTVGPVFMEFFTYLVAVAVPRQKSKLTMHSQSFSSSNTSKGKSLTWNNKCHAITVNPVSHSENEDRPEKDSNCKRCMHHQQSVITKNSFVPQDPDDNNAPSAAEDGEPPPRLVGPPRRKIQLSLYRHSDKLSHVIHHVPRFTICSSTTCTSINSGSSSDAFNKARTKKSGSSSSLGGIGGNKSSSDNAAAGSSSGGNSQFKFVCFLCRHEYCRESTLNNHLKVYHKIDPPDVSYQRK